MDIYPLGHSSFRIKGKTATVVTDPYLKSSEADIVTVSHDHQDHNVLAKIDGALFVVRAPGEYEIKGVTIIGVPTFHDDKDGTDRGKNVVYKMTIDDVRICHLGDLGHKLTDSQVEAIGSVDILFVPVGGKYTIDAKMAVQVVAQIEPSVVIPMHYSKELELEPVQTFLKEMGAEAVVAVPKLSTTREKLPETTTVVVLE